MEALWEALQADWASVVRLAPRALYGGVVFVVSVWVGRRVGRWLRGVLERGKGTRPYAPLAQHVGTWGLALVGLVIATNILGLRSIAVSIMAAGGATAIIVGFAFREIGENMLAGLLFSVRPSFDVGDLIESTGHRGVVRDISLMNVVIRAANECDVFLPSAVILRNPLLNFTRDGLRRLAFTIGIDYGDDSAEARTVIRDVIREIDGVLEHPVPASRVVEFAAQFVVIEGAFWCDTERGTNLERVRTAAMERAKAALREAHFTMSSEVSQAVEVRSRPAA